MMASHIELGKQGEQLAEDYLVKKGFTILHRNWRHSHYEIDIIALKNNVLQIIEVKLRKFYANPEESVSRKKLKYLMQAADEFLYRNKQYKHIQINILAITICKDGSPEYFFIEDVYL
jgi:putative endonuclease